MSRAIPVGITAKLAAGQTTLCTALRITRTDGTVIALTDNRTDLVLDGITYIAKASYTKSAIRWESDLAPTTIEIDGAFLEPQITAIDLQAGLYDRSTAQVWRVDWQHPADKDLLLDGAVGEITIKDHAFTLELRGKAAALAAQIVEVYSAMCRADLGDARCKVVPVQLANTVASVSSPTAIVLTSNAAGRANTDFNEGYITFTSGAAAGLKVELREFRANRTAVLYLPLSKLPAPGDSAVLTIGCDKLPETCRTKFANIKNFRGEPFIPGSTRVLRFPDAKS